MLRPLFALVAALACSVMAQAEVLDRTATAGGLKVQYKVVLPNKYDPAKTYPAILAFGGGPQTMNTVEAVLDRNLQTEAEKRGWLVFAPAAPENQLFFEDGDRIFPEFFKMLVAEYHIEGGKFHAAGPSNGGITAMHVAAKFPEYFKSVTAFPGYLWQPTAAKLDHLQGICVFLYVGGYDEYRWHPEMQDEVAYLRSKGTKARYNEEPDQPHRIETLARGNAWRLFVGFDEARQSCTR